MKPKLKAEDLVCDFYAIQSNEYNYGIDWKMAKKCALIAVDEIIELRKGYFDCTNPMQDEKYWQQVKQEIESL
jgi:hypothetical protein